VSLRSRTNPLWPVSHVSFFAQRIALQRTTVGHDRGSGPYSRQESLGVPLAQWFRVRKLDRSTWAGRSLRQAGWSLLAATMDLYLRAFDSETGRTVEVFNFQREGRPRR